VRAALAAHPDAAELLIGLAQTLYWKGQPALAEAYAARARAAAPLDLTARELERVVRAALRPEVATTADGAGDSDSNTFVAQEGTLTASLGGQLRGTLHAGWRRATDRAGDGTSFGAGGYAIAALGGGAVLRAGLGARRVEPDVGPARTPLTAQLGLGLHPARYAAVSVGYSRTPFDETAALMRQALTLDAVDLSFDVSPVPGWSISGGGGGAWLSDGNRRDSAVGSVLGRAQRAGACRLDYDLRRRYVDDGHANRGVPVSDARVTVPPRVVGRRPSPAPAAGARPAPARAAAARRPPAASPLRGGESCAR